ncbi:MAG: ATP phosphoribosyltransferase regulatory subunit [Chthoniobacteraceae bacterium]
MEKLAGFRDFYPADCARRNYVLTTWCEVARRYGFVEFDGPVVESMELYEKKSGGELVGQLFTVGASAEPGVVKGALRPEMTPTLARMVAARERDFKKPIKWFCVPNFFRHERQQRGRLREFYQLNCDIIGEASPAADAELLAVQIDMLRAFGLTGNDFVVRLSSRDVWANYLMHKRVDQGGGFADAEFQQLLAIVDKMERQSDEVSNRQLEPLRTTVADIRSWMQEWQDKLRDPNSISGNTPLARLHEILHTHLAPRGLLEYVAVDFGIVRGLAYYTGVVFEVFDRGKVERALSGGGRYDRLLGLMSDGKVDLPALGFGMGDVVLLNLIDEIPSAKAKLDAWCAAQHACDIYVVIAKEELRPQALALVQELRDAGKRIDFSLTPSKVGKQFQAAEHLGARLAVVIGEEWPRLKVKTLATREEREVRREEIGGL